VGELAETLTFARLRVYDTRELGYNPRVSQLRSVRRRVVSEMENASFEQVLEVAKALPVMDKRRLQYWLMEDERAQSYARDNGETKLPYPREREMRWFAAEQNRAKYGGQWVALDGDQLLSHGENLRQVYAEAKAKGVESPFTGYVDPLDAPPFGE
jgi:hypothetical protein